jgi:3-dehydroquinate synthase
MIDKINTEFIEKHSVDFVQDDNKELKWLSQFKSDKYDKFLVFIDNNVRKIWGEIFLTQLNSHNKEIVILGVDAIEESKSINFYPEAISFLEKNRCSRFDLVLAVGGGIILDLVSFVVSTYMRGIPLMMVPTTLIGQTDASTAGKTCLNSKNSKNLLGTFYYPMVVYNNINFLTTNTNRFLRQGFSESFKYGLLDSNKLVDKLIIYKKSKDILILKDIITLTINSRIAIRYKDALVSNLGHTFGHAIEKFSNYKILHGDAISVGTVIALHYAVHIGIMNKKIKNKIIDIMKLLGLNLYIDDTITSDALVDLMLLDKKSSSTALNLVLIKNISDPYEDDGMLFYKSLPENVKLFLDIFFESYDYRISNCAKLLEQDDISY